MPKRRNTGAKKNSASAKPRRRRASPDRLRERSTDTRYNRMTYSQPDASSLSRGDTKSGYPTDAPAYRIAMDPSWRGGPWTDSPDVPLRRQAAGGPTRGTDSGRSRRKQSNLAALMRADASMFNYDD